MATTLTEEEAETLRKLIASGVQSVEANGRRVVYRPLDDLQNVASNASAAASGKKRRRFASFSKGY